MASTVSTLEPASTVVLAAIVLNETLSLSRLLGGLVVLLGAAILARSTATASRVEATAEH